MNYLSRLLDAFLQRLLWFFIYSLVKTYRIEIQGNENREKALSLHDNKSFIMACWHEQVMAVMSSLAWTHPYLALASRSRDGDYAAFVSKKFGFTSVRGSSRKRNKDKGGKEAMLEYIEKLRQGMSGGITVDGPKGPRQECKPGVVVIAKETGSPILPVVGLAEKYWEFNSWDRFKIPRPFTKIVLRFGPPILVKHDIDQENIQSLCQQVRDSLKSLMQEA